MTQTPDDPSPLARLLSIMAALRTPVTGCPWDLEQTFETIAPYTIEEAYEVADAIARGDLADLKDELGDLLLQVVYHARMAEEQGAFAFDDVAQAVSTKMLRRHPHVFGTPEERAAGAMPDFWARIKAEETAEKTNERLGRAAAQDTAPLPLTGRGRGWGEEARGTGEESNEPLPPTPNPSPPARPKPLRRGEGPQGGGGTEAIDKQSTLSNVPIGLPALTRAVKLQDKAARVGFDWPSLTPVFDKLKEELREFEEVALPADPRGRTPSSVVGNVQGAPDVKETPPPLWGRQGGGEAQKPAMGSPTTPNPSLPARPKPLRRGEGPQGGGEKQNTRIEEELGDMLFVMANIARHLKIDPEAALRSANHKFTRRFQYIETRLAEDGRTPSQSNLEEMDRLWDEIRARDKGK